MIKLLLGFVGSIIYTTGDAFTPSPRWTSRSDVTHQRFTKSRPFPQLALSNENPTSFPALSEEEVKSLLDDIPLFAVTDENGEAVILLKEQDNPNEIAYFFLTPETAKSVYAPLKSKMAGDVVWSVNRFSLGLIWFELLKNPAVTSTSVIDGIDYRIFPDARELESARSMIQQSIKEPAEVPNVFQASYNEIPIFFDKSLRLGGKKLPMFFGLEGLTKMCQQASGAGSGGYEPTINIANLHSLVNQMMQDKSTVDYRSIAMIPPTVQLPGDSVDETKNAEEELEDIEVTTVTDMWTD